MAVEITKEKIQAFEDVRSSGVTNMYNLPVVMVYSGLTKAECIEIIGKYDYYVKKHGIKRG